MARTSRVEHPTLRESRIDSEPAIAKKGELHFCVSVLSRGFFMIVITASVFVCLEVFFMHRHRLARC